MDAAAAKSLQSCLTLCDPIDGGPPGSPVPEILQARTLEWVTISFSNAWRWKEKVKSFSRVRLFATSWTAAYQAPPSMGFSRQEYWSGVPLPSPSHPYLSKMSLAIYHLHHTEIFFTLSCTHVSIKSRKTKHRIEFYWFRGEWDLRPALLISITLIISWSDVYRHLGSQTLE